MIKNIKELTDHFQDVFDEYVHQKSENPLKNHTIELIENPKFGKTRAPNFKGMEKQVENKLQTLKEKESLQNCHQTNHLKSYLLMVVPKKNGDI